MSATSRHRYGYWQMRPYQPRYRFFRSPAAVPYGRALGTVYRVSTWWEAATTDDPPVYGKGFTRDAAVGDALSKQREVAS